MKYNNIIFLDIDGVMNSELYYRKRHYKLKNRLIRFYYRIKSYFRWLFTGLRYKTYNLSDYEIDPKHYEFPYSYKRLMKETDPIKWKWLIELCKETNSKIVISSCWKTHFTSDGWNKAFDKIGFPTNTFIGITGERRTLRGTEIKECLETLEYNDYVIIDDDNDMLPEQMAHFFNTDNYVGFTPTTYYRIKRFLNKEK